MKKCIFETPYNEIKCVLSTIESYSIEKNGSTFSHLLTVRVNGADPPSRPDGQPDGKISVFYDFPNNEICQMSKTSENFPLCGYSARQIFLFALFT